MHGRAACSSKSTWPYPPQPKTVYLYSVPVCRSNVLTHTLHAPCFRRLFRRPATSGRISRSNCQILPLKMGRRDSRGWLCHGCPRPLEAARSAELASSLAIARPTVRSGARQHNVCRLPRCHQNIVDHCSCVCPTRAKPFWCAARVPSITLLSPRHHPTGPAPCLQSQGRLFAPMTEATGYEGMSRSVGDTSLRLRLPTQMRERLSEARLGAWRGTLYAGTPTYRSGRGNNRI
jgi:hypothetical protein